MLTILSYTCWSFICFHHRNVQHFCLLLKLISCFLLRTSPLSCRIPFYILNISLLSDIWFVNIFSHSVNCLGDSEVSQSCPTLCNPMDYCSPPGSSVHGILQAGILEWVAISFSRGSSWPRDRTQVSCVAGTCFNLWATREVTLY